jgi:hypothetical protein
VTRARMRASQFLPASDGHSSCSVRCGPRAT